MCKETSCPYTSWFALAEVRTCKLRHRWAKPLQGKENQGKFLKRAWTQQHPLSFSGEQRPHTSQNSAMVFSAQMGAIRSAELMKAWSKKMRDEPGEEEEEKQGRAGGPETCATYLRINGSACSPGLPAHLFVLVKSWFTSIWIPIATLMLGL